MSTPKHGGKRIGAGRPPGSENLDTKTRAALKRRWLERINEVADQIFDAHLDLALGHFKTVKTPDGTYRLYKKSPSGLDLQWMQEHIWGKAPLKIDLDADIGVHGAQPINPEHYASILTVMERWGLIKPEQAEQAARDYAESSPSEPDTEPIPGASDAGAG